ncbi:MAG: hypothetical protein ABSH12_08310 [Endomicrobiales bacterium]|jgi:hypothetical protein
MGTLRGEDLKLDAAGAALWGCSGRSADISGEINSSDNRPNPIFLMEAL